MIRVLKAVVALTGTLYLVSSTTIVTRGQSSQNVRYPTMLDMTFPEFEAAVKKTDIVLLPIGAIEEHSSHLPLGVNASARCFSSGRQAPDVSAAIHATAQHRPQGGRGRAAPGGYLAQPFISATQMGTCSSISP